MGLRIIDRRERQLRQRLQAMRSELIKIEALRFASMKGGDSSRNEQEFLGKIDHIRALLATETKAREVAEQLEQRIIDEAKSSVLLQGPIEPSIALDLL